MKKASDMIFTFNNYLRLTKRVCHFIYNVCQDLSFRRKLRFCKFRWLFNINEGLGLLKLANKVLILINPSPNNVKKYLMEHMKYVHKDPNASGVPGKNSILLI